jgi:hypothetical protein
VTGGRLVIVGAVSHPKIELHVHLEGTVRAGTLLHLGHLFPYLPGQPGRRPHPGRRDRPRPAAHPGTDHSHLITAIWHNDHTSAPVHRSLTACDH